ncbi:hypothetical protein J4455_05365 [Candidatus Woesearchaeota archaeon]|nr:hypothetical protein [Candidatus Woesearchaeota archaeon]
MRNQLWLEKRLNNIWQLLFPEVEKKNNVIIKFKGKWKNKFGHIKTLKNKDTEIAVNSLFQSSLIPEHIVDLTIAHELIHYSHGFHSPLPKLYSHPHKGGIVTKELKKRGFGNQLNLEKQFVKEEWTKIYIELMKIYKEKRQIIQRDPEISNKKAFKLSNLLRWV